MLVKCVINNIKDIKDDSEIMHRLSEEVHTENGEISLKVSKIYNVYAVSFEDTTRPRYFIANEHYVDYPMWYYASFFEIVDSRLSRYWEFGYELVYKDDGQVSFSHAILTFKEWAKDRTFYERLLNGEDKEFQIFDKYKKLIDEEFSLPIEETRRPRERSVSDRRSAGKDKQSLK